MGSRGVTRGLRTSFAIAVAVFGLSVTVPAAIAEPGEKPACWDSRGYWSGYGVVTQKYEPEFAAYNSVAADDFRLTKRCRVRGLTIVGTHWGGIGPADSENITIYRGGKREPGRVVFEATIAGVDDDGWLSIPITPVVTLRKGHYWLAVQANENFTKAGQFGWLAVDDGTRYGRPALWQNPGDGFETGCTSWQPLRDCLWSDVGLDLKFSVDRTFGLRPSGRQPPAGYHQAASSRPSIERAFSREQSGQ